MVSDGGGRWTSRSISAVCSGLSWTHREVMCEEGYMEVNVNRESSCGGQRGDGGPVWHEALSQAQRKARVAWQLMFLQSDGQPSSMSIPEAQRWGYRLTATTKRVVLRSPYKQPHAEVTMMDGVPVEAVGVSLFFKQKLVVVMIDLSMACAVNSGSFDGSRLLWDIPEVLPPLVGEGTGFDSRSFSLGLDGVLLDEPTATSRGLTLVQQEGLVKISIPFGAEGGYRKSLVEANMYQEEYKILLLYEQVFSLVYDDGSSLDTKYRTLKMLTTPLICRPPFSLNWTIGGDQVFSVYLGNIPDDVILEEVWINGKQLLLSGKPQQGLDISPVLHNNGSRSYELQLPFDHAAVRWMNVGGGLLQYYMDMNFTLTVMPQRESYHHHTFISAQVFKAFPPEITAQCLDGGISFSVIKQSHSLWEVGIDQEPLTTQLVAQRGYRLHNDSLRTILEVPVFSVGYTYDEINLSNFYAIFKLLLRDSKTLEVQASASKRCLFRTEDMIACSPDGIMTVVATPAFTWPSVQPERTSLLDRTCRPKQRDRTRVLFEFQLDSCGTRAMVGEWYVVYENEILHDRLLIADGPNFISRESQFKVTVRCFYPLSAVNRLSVDRRFTSAAPGFGSLKVFESHKDAVNKPCSHQGFENPPANRVHPVAGGTLPLPKPQPKPGHLITAPGRNKNLLSTPNPPSSETQAYHVPQLPHRRTQWIRLDKLTQSSLGKGSGISGQHKEYPTVEALGRIPDVPVGEKLESLTRTSEILNGVGQKETVKQNPDLQTPPLDSFLSIPDLSQPHETKPAWSLYGSSAGGMERPVYQPKSWPEPPKTPELHPYLEPHAGNELLLSGNYKTHVPGDSKHSIPDSLELLQRSMSKEPTTATGRDAENPEITAAEKRNARFSVQNIRVKPPSRFVSAGPHLNQKPVVQQANPSQHAAGPPAASGDRNHGTSRQPPEPRSSTPRGKNVPQIQERGLYGGHHHPDRSAMTNLTNLSPDQPGRHQKPLQETEPKGRETIPFRRDVLQTAGTSRLRVGPAHLSGRLQNQSTLLQNPDSVTFQNFVPHVKFGISKVKVQNLMPGRSVSTDPQTDPDGSDFNPRIQSGLDCGGDSSRYGASVHQGIIRGKGSAD
ncbi:uncharacterized protein PAE49_001928 isoform 2-T4 [Odontesthes bonariensis]|uniref:uncharacterized protein LOC142375439 isoform X2 n=1 Tax=Odontesthes bonariensis TaxID=219752 RepID=UPI003F586D55